MKLLTLDPQVLQQGANGSPFLRVLLQPNQAAALPMEQAQEAIAIPTNRITPVPNMPIAFLGLLNHKSRVIWVVDLPLLLGISDRTLNTQQYNIVIVRVGKTLLGMVVPEIKGVVRFAPELIESPVGEVPEGLAPYLRGCWLQEQETLWVLEPEAIIRSLTSATPQ